MFALTLVEKKIPGLVAINISNSNSLKKSDKINYGSQYSQDDKLRNLADGS